MTGKRSYASHPARSRALVALEELVEENEKLKKDLGTAIGIAKRHGERLLALREMIGVEAFGEALVLADGQQAKDGK